MNIKYAHGAAAGSFHVKENMECQDKIKIVDENGVVAIALADGVDHKENSRISSVIVVEAVTNLLKERFEELFSLDDDLTKTMIFKRVMLALGATELPLFSIASTLCFVAVKGNRCLAGQIGNGLIVSMEKHCSVLLKAPEGLAEGETYFITDLNGNENLQIYKAFLQEPFGFMLMSDGAGKSLYFNTGDLSPVCGTLLEWLKEYDEETVSEALAENIKKYFMQNTEDDITIAMMVSAETEQGEENEQTEEEPEALQTSVSETKSTETITYSDDLMKATEEKRKFPKYAIAAMILVLVCCIGIFALASRNNDAKDNANPSTSAAAIENKDTTADKKTVVTHEEVFKASDYYPSITYNVESPVMFSAGEYQIGVDIPAGEYFFTSTGEMMQPDSIEINGESCLSGELYCMNIQLAEGDTLYSKHSFISSDSVDPIQPVKGVLISGKYKIGKDIAPGEYVISSVDKKQQGRCYVILDGEIGEDVTYDDSAVINVPAEGYVVAYNSFLVVNPETTLGN